MKEIIDVLGDIVEAHHMSEVDWDAMRGAEDILKNAEKYRVLEQMHNRVSQAKEKHPQFCPEGGLYQAVSILTEEVGEVAQAVNDGELGRVLDELYDVAAVCVRMIEHIDIAGGK